MTISDRLNLTRKVYLSKPESKWTIFGSDKKGVAC